MLLRDLEQQLAKVIQQQYDLAITPEIQQTEASFGDFSSNVAFKVAKKVKRSPQEVATKLAEGLRSPLLDKAEPAGHGFINMVVNDQSLAKTVFVDIEKAIPQPLKGQVIVTEYSDPNPFKELHAGHLYTSVVGESISRLLEAVGAEVHRVNFGGDVGLHVGKAMWGILQQLQGKNPSKLDKISKNQRVSWLSSAYVSGATAYEKDPAAKREIDILNKSVYRLHEQDDHQSLLAQIYWTCRQWSYDYFDDFYDLIGVKFEKYYPESETMEPGLRAVNSQLKTGVFATSDGAVVFKGEEAGQHTRVFITSAGLPTYETKDIGLALLKWKDYKFDQSISITGNDIDAYMKVIMAALSKFEPSIAKRSVHLSHGMVKLRGGAKMSSRSGNVLTASAVLEAVREQNKATNNSNDERISLGAVKYAFLKHQIGGDIIYNPKESLTLTGNSGPYLQYVATRIRSILQKSGKSEGQLVNAEHLLPGERKLILQLIAYPRVIEQAARLYAPQQVATFLHQLAQDFNAFYEQERIIGHAREEFRIGLITALVSTIEHGLDLLGIAIPAKM